MNNTSNNNKPRMDSLPQTSSLGEGTQLLRLVDALIGTQYQRWRGGADRTAQHLVSWPLPGTSASSNALMKGCTRLLRHQVTSVTTQAADMLGRAGEAGPPQKS